jgi:hypothetical protein
LLGVVFFFVELLKPALLALLVHLEGGRRAEISSSREEETGKGTKERRTMRLFF